MYYIQFIKKELSIFWLLGIINNLATIYFRSPWDVIVNDNYFGKNHCSSYIFVRSVHSNSLTLHHPFTTYEGSFSGLLLNPIKS